MTGPKADEIHIRRANQGDLETIVQFNVAMARETEGKTLVMATVRAGVQTLLGDASRGFYLVAESAGRVVGQLMITSEWSDWRNAYFWWIQSVYVSQDFRRMGIYRSLNDQVQSQARNQGDVCGIRLYVDKDNRVAQQVYASLDMAHARYDLFEIEFDRRI